MRGLIRTTIIIMVIIAVGVATSIIITNDLNNRVAATARGGLKEGRVYGYEVGLQDGSRTGYQEGSRIGYAEATGEDCDSMDEAGFHFLYNPTYDEVQQILSEDDKGSAKKINNDAELQGIRAAYVRCWTVTVEGKVYVSELVAFETVDKGFIFIEPSSHQEVKLEIGERYSELNGVSALKHDGIISDIKIIW